MISPEKNVQIIVSLLKESGIKQVVVSPGNTNVSFVLSVQEDPFFKVTSVVDERSAAYLRLQHFTGNRRACCYQLHGCYSI